MPSEIGSMTSLEYLNLEMNEFEGPLPADVGNLENLKVSGLRYLFPLLLSKCVFHVLTTCWLFRA